VSELKLQPPKTLDYDDLKIFVSNLDTYQRPAEFEAARIARWKPTSC